MKKKLILLLVVVLALSLAVVACSRDNEGENNNSNNNNAQVEQSGPYGTLKIASVDFSYESTDPINYESLWGFAMYDPLITIDENGNYIGGVAEDWELSEDGLTWTFYIRKGIKFHNGDELTAHDVKFSVDRFANQSEIESTNPWTPYLAGNYNYTEVVDDYTFRYHCQRPELPLLVPFSWTRIIPKNYYEEVGMEEFRKNPIGSGPYKFVELVPETSFKMEANTEHWRFKPDFMYVEEYQVPEEMTRINMLRTGEVDIALGITNERMVELRDNEGFATVKVGDPVLWTISFPGTWSTRRPTGDIRVRQAMSYAINREELCESYFKGLAVPGGRWYMHPGCYGWDPSWKPDPYDPELAMQLLEEAGYPDAFEDKEIIFYVTPGPMVEQAQLLQDYWRKVGVEVDVQTIDTTQWSGMFFIRNTEPDAPNVGNIFPWQFSSTFNSVYQSANMFTSNGVHSTGNDAKADELYQKVVSELDPVLAEQYWTEFRDYVEGLYYNVGICIIEPNILVNPETVAEFTACTNMTLYDALAGIKHPK